MRRIDLNKKRHVVNKTHHNWVPTSEIAKKLKESYPRLEFRWLEQEHIHGVDSVVHGLCHEHHEIVPMHVGNLWRGTTKYGCPACARELGFEVEGSSRFHVRRNAPNFQGRSMVEYNLFLAIKDEFPDALSGHKMQGGKEIDIWIPSIRAGVEYNGNFYHSEKRGRGEFYHHDKSVTGFKQEKFIFHLFTEEAENVGAIVRSLILFRNYTQGITIPETTVTFGPITVSLASGFHRDWNPVRDFNTRGWEWSMAIYDDKFHTIGIVSGTQRPFTITKISVKDYSVPIGQIVSKFAKSYNLKPLISVDTRNPAELVVAEIAGFVKCGAISPLALPMDKNYRIMNMRRSFPEGVLWGDVPVQSEEVDRAWDCGRMLFHLKNRQPDFIKHALHVKS